MDEATFHTKDSHGESTFVLGLLQTILAALAVGLGFFTLLVHWLKWRERHRRNSRHHQCQPFELEAQLPEVCLQSLCKQELISKVLEVSIVMKDGQKVFREPS